MAALFDGTCVTFVKATILQTPGAELELSHKVDLSNDYLLRFNLL